MMAHGKTRKQLTLGQVLHRRCFLPGKVVKLMLNRKTEADARYIWEQAGRYEVEMLVLFDLFDYK